MKRIVADTAPINGISYLYPGTPLDWTSTGYTPKMDVETEAGTSSIAATAITAHPTQTFTAAASSPFLATCNDHGIKEGDQLIVASGGTLPSGLAASTRYFAVQVTPNSFGLASTPGGVNLIAGAGTGAHTFYVVGSWQATAAQVAISGLTVGRYRAWVTAYNSSTPIETDPADSLGFPIEILSRGN